MLRAIIFEWILSRRYNYTGAHQTKQLDMHLLNSYLDKSSTQVYQNSLHQTKEKKSRKLEEEGVEKGWDWEEEIVSHERQQIICEAATPDKDLRSSSP